MDEEEICLPADTLKILNEFLQEKAQREENEIDIIETQAGKTAKFEENWQLSQFWYNEQTKKTLGHVVSLLIQENNCSEECNIALLSCPSLYETVKKIHNNVKIFEFDKRFAAYGDDFVFYDFNCADTENYLNNSQEQFDIIIADPPFLSEECISKMCSIIKTLQKLAGKIIFCSGEVVEPWLATRLPVTKCKYQPEHERNLANEFVSYANFSLDELIES